MPGSSLRCGAAVKVQICHGPLAWTSARCRGYEFPLALPDAPLGHWRIAIAGDPSSDLRMIHFRLFLISTLLGLTASACLGLATAVGGGVLRDVLANEVLRTFGGDTVDDLQARVAAYRERLAAF